jgi:hypothetical protein
MGSTAHETANQKKSKPPEQKQKSPKQNIYSVPDASWYSLAETTGALRGLVMQNIVIAVIE